jgi:glucoamylase
MQHGDSSTGRSQRCWPVRASGIIISVTSLALVTVMVVNYATQSSVPSLYMQGIAQNPCSANHVFAVPVGAVAAYVPDTSILKSQSSSACRDPEIASDREWLAAGQVPGDNQPLKEMATRALLDLHSSERSNGTVIAGLYPGWNYTWPRDSSWAATAFAYTSHFADAYAILRFLQRTQLPNGWWAARYSAEGEPVSDGRPDELDADGWVPWAVWCWLSAVKASGRDYLGQLKQLWPMVKAAADAATRALTPTGLPIAAMDYWEHGVEVTLGTAAPLLSGLRAAADIAAEIGVAASARLWHRAAAMLTNGIQTGFGRFGYHRVAYATSGSDAAVTFLGPPFAASSSAVAHAVKQTMNAIMLPNGGVLPGSDWAGNRTVAWTAETAFFSLYYAENGDQQIANHILKWLVAHRTNLGAIPEMVNAQGQPVSVAPLAWTDAIVLLALTAQSHSLPVVPNV